MPGNCCNRDITLKPGVGTGNEPINLQAILEPERHCDRAFAAVESLPIGAATEHGRLGVDPVHRWQCQCVGGDCESGRHVCRTRNRTQRTAQHQANCHRLKCP